MHALYPTCDLARLAAATQPLIVPTQKSSFSMQAAKIRAALNATTSKLQKLAKRAQSSLRRSAECAVLAVAQSKAYAFGDPVKDIDELSFVIKEDIKSLQIAVQDMQVLRHPLRTPPLRLRAHRSNYGTGRAGTPSRRENTLRLLLAL